MAINPYEALKASARAALSEEDQRIVREEELAIDRCFEQLWCGGQFMKRSGMPLTGPQISAIIRLYESVGWGATADPVPSALHASQDQFMRAVRAGDPVHVMFSFTPRWLETQTQKALALKLLG